MRRNRRSPSAKCARIAPLLNQPGIEFIGEINEHQKAKFLGQAAGLLFPIDWPEPFGLVMIEAMACGTPVLAFNRGSVSEIVEDGKTGIVVRSKDEAIKRLPHLLSLNRRRIRQEFERRFTAQRMASDHLRLYQAILKGEPEYLVQNVFERDALGNAQQASQLRSAVQ